MRVVVLVDGFNLYHALDRFDGAADHTRYHKYKWLNLKRLAECYIRSTEQLSAVYYFTTLATWDWEKAKRHRAYITALDSVGVTTILGEFKERDRQCRICSKQYKAYEEKETDVNIAVTLMRLAFEDKFDKLIIISGDTDFVPAIQTTKLLFPSKQIGVIVPIGKLSDRAKAYRHTDFHFKMKEPQLASSQFSDPLILPDKTTLTCPSTWKAPSSPMSQEAA